MGFIQLTSVFGYDFDDLLFKKKFFAASCQSILWPSQECWFCFIFFENINITDDTKYHIKFKMLNKLVDLY